jgi:heterodisulfide reductase subunit A
MSVGETKVEAISAEINKDLCSRCLICIGICPFNALTYDGENIEVLEVLCKGCGACATACPTKAIKMKNFTDTQILAELKESLSSPPGKV